MEDLDISSENSGYETAEEGDTLENHMSASIAELESTTVSTKGSILRSIDEIKMQMEDGRAINEALKKDLDEAKRALREKGNELEEVNGEIAVIKSNLGTIEGLKDEISFANEELKNAQNMIEDQKAMFDEKEETIKQLQGRLITIEEEKSKLLVDVKSEMENSRDLQRELIEISREKESLTMKYHTMESELAKLRGESKALEEIHQALADTKRSSRR